METILNSVASESVVCSNSDNSCHYLNEIMALRREVNFLTDQVRTDALTGLYNFRFFSDTIVVEMERTRRGVQPLAMILLDVDHFKNFNDQWGHELGNQALIHVANLIKIAVRKLDYSCRFGGEEFVILLPNTDLCQAIHVAERLRETIAHTELIVDKSTSTNITASFGVDLFSSYMSDTTEGFIQRVDAWLYQAKHQGRNRVAHPDVAVVTRYESVTVEEKNALFALHPDSLQNNQVEQQ